MSRTPTLTLKPQAASDGGLKGSGEGPTSIQTELCNIQTISS